MRRDQAPPRVVPPLVEREAEIAALAAGLDRALAGAETLIVIEGDAGVGKTRLLAEAISLAAQREVHCLEASGIELEQGFPFGLMRRLLAPALRGWDDGRIDGLASRGAGPAVSLLLGDPPPGPPPRDSLFALTHGLTVVCEELAGERPLAIVVDDLHWADRPSAEAIALLAGRIDQLAIAIIVAMRTGEPLAGPDPRESLAERSAAIGLTLDELSEVATGRILEVLLGRVEDSFAASAHRATAGNPFLVRELALTVAREGIATDSAGARQVEAMAPSAVRGWASRRLALIGESAQALAASLAVLERAELRLAAAHAGVAEAELHQTVDRLAGAGLIDPELPLRLAHPLVRSALYAAIPPASRDEAHHRAAVLLAERGQQPDRIATHLLACEPRGDAWAVNALWAAATEASTRGASDRAARLLARAAAEPGWQQDPELLLELGLAKAALSDPSSLPHLKAAAAAATDPGLRARALGALGQIRYLTGEIRTAISTVEEGLEALPPGGGGVVEAELLVSYGLAARQVPGLASRLRDLIAVPRPAPGGEPSLGEVVRRSLLGLDAFLCGDRERAVAAARWAAERLATPAVGEVIPSLLAIGPAFVLTGVGEYAEANAIIERSLARARRRGSRVELAEALNERVWMRWRRGEVAAGIADAETIFELTQGAFEVSKVPLRVALADLLLERGDPDASARALSLPHGLEDRLAETWGWIWLPFGRARLAFAGGEWQASERLAAVAGAHSDEIDARSAEWLPWRPLAARAAARAGALERARALAGDAIEAGRAIRSPRAVGLGLAALAAVEDGERAVGPLREAVGELDQAGALLEAARARVELGMKLRRQ
ncbi:MAG: ATP-binding protein, partial [Solirubrobacterales bacterium]